MKNLKRHLIILTALFSVFIAEELQAQDRTINAGIEIDALPYVFNGYMGAIWVKQNHFRLRALYAKVKMPDFIVPDDFTNNKINSFAFLLDYYPNQDLSGWWFGGGPVIWNGSIQSKERLSTVKYNSYLLNGSIGYTFFLYDKIIYISPWAGLSLRFTGDKDIKVDSFEFDPRILNPELSVKIGWTFL